MIEKPIPEAEAFVSQVIMPALRDKGPFGVPEIAQAADHLDGPWTYDHENCEVTRESGESDDVVAAKAQKKRQESHRLLMERITAAVGDGKLIVDREDWMRTTVFAKTEVMCWVFLDCSYRVEPVAQSVAVAMLTPNRKEILATISTWWFRPLSRPAPAQGFSSEASHVL